jgi:micrococcal nuclease
MPAGPGTSRTLRTGGTRTRQPSRGIAVVVTRVVDGDTVHVRPAGGGRDIDVRVLGIDTPETVDPRKPVECGGPAASAWAEQLLTGTALHLRRDRTQSGTDKYGRTLAYLTLPDGKDYSILAARKGFAKAYTYDEPVAEAPEIRSAQATARAAGRGLWGAPCDGDASKPAPGHARARTEAHTSTGAPSPGGTPPHGRYHVGEFCAKKYLGTTTIADDGKPITCTRAGRADRWRS